MNRNANQLPFQHLNLRVNPFGEWSPDELRELVVTDVEGFVAKLKEDKKYAVQFLGEKGRGKTTHLLAILRHFPDSPYVHLPEDGPLPAIPEGNFLFIDEIQRLPRRKRRRLFRTARKLVIGSHEDVADELRVADFDVDTIHVHETMDADRLWTLLNARVEKARRGPGPVPRVLHSTADRLLKEHNSDVRAIQRSLYEIFQSMRQIENV